MTNLVPADDIERIVGIKRHQTKHYGRAVSAEQTGCVIDTLAKVVLDATVEAEDADDAMCAYMNMAGWW